MVDQRVANAFRPISPNPPIQTFSILSFLVSIGGDGSGPITADGVAKQV
jgi:hypothetical protein